MNASTIKAYYNDGKSTMEIYFDRKTNKLSSQTIATISYLLVPSGFELNTLIFPGVISPPVNTTLTKIYQ
jgi:hypothetical protein